MTEQAAFAEALAAFQAEMPHVDKEQKANTGTYGYSYAGLEDIAPKVLPILARHGLSWTAKPEVTDAGFVLTSSLLHVGGHREGGSYPLPDPSKSNPQQIGSAITYARRYSFTALTGVTPGGEDDDGKRAEEARSAPRPQPAVVDEKQAELNRAKRRVKTLGDKLGMDMDALTAEFHVFTEGAELRSAGLLQLQTFADYLGHQSAPEAAS